MEQFDTNDELMIEDCHDTKDMKLALARTESLLQNKQEQKIDVITWKRQTDIILNSMKKNNENAFNGLFLLELSN